MGVKLSIPGIVLHRASCMTPEDATRTAYGFFTERPAEDKEIDKQTT